MLLLRSVIAGRAAVSSKSADAEIPNTVAILSTISGCGHVSLFSIWQMARKHRLP